MRTRLRSFVSIWLALGALALSPGIADAHPLGLPAFARITASAPAEVTLVWNAAPDDVAELGRALGHQVEGITPTLAEDAELSASARVRAALLDGVTVAQGGRACPGDVEVDSLTRAGATLRFTCPDAVDSVTVRLTLLVDLDERYRTLGVAGGPEGVERVMFTATAPEHEVRLDPASAHLVEAGAAAVPAEDAPATRQPFGGALPFESAFVALIDREPGPLVVALGLLIALGVGAAHGLAPGHGKAIAAAYLVGDRGRPRDAIALGAVVALMHTWSVLALGFALYSATRRPATAALSAWLQLVAGLLVLGLGLWLLWRRARERGLAHHQHTHDRSDHGHHHLPANGGDAPHPLSWQGLVALGAAGGLLPSPSALLVLFTALAVGRLAYGLGLIAAFSVGLAATVSVVGLLVLAGRDALRRRGASPAVARLLRAAPLVGATAVAVLGAAVTLRAAFGLLA